MTLLAIVAIHTAANERPKVRQVMNKIHRNVGPWSSGQGQPPALLPPALALEAPEAPRGVPSPSASAKPHGSAAAAKSATPAA